MKALILSAGIGKRLEDLTKSTPKVMLDINGKPCLQYQIENMRNQGIKEFAINTHYFPEKIKDYFGSGEKFRVEIHYSFEPELLGTAGALNNFRDFFDSTFAVIYGDVLANFNLKTALETHFKNKAEGTIALDSKRSMVGKGAVLSESNNVKNFIEKPEKEIQNALINSGFYIFEKSVLNRIPEGFSDFGKNILPEMAKTGRLYCFQHKGYIFDIGTVKDLQESKKFMEKLNL